MHSQRKISKNMVMLVIAMIVFSADGVLLISHINVPQIQNSQSHEIIEHRSTSYWAKSYGTSDYDDFYSAVPTNNGYAITGTYSGNVSLTAIDDDGGVSWAKSYYMENSPTIGRSIGVTSSGQYTIAGSLYNGNDQDALVMMTTSNGNVKWVKKLSTSYDDMFYGSMVTGDDGNLLLGFEGGNGYDSVYVVKMDTSGNIIFDKAYSSNIDGNDMSGEAYSAVEVSDGYVIAALMRKGDTGITNVVVFKTDPNGLVQWAKEYNTTKDEHNVVIDKTSEGGFIVGATSEAFSATYDAWVMKLDSSGNIVWQYAYNTGDTDFIKSVRQTSDGGYVVAGYTDANGGGYRFWMMKLNSDGDIVWQKTYGGSNFDYSTDVHETSDGGYILFGDTYSFGAGERDGWVVKTDSNGYIDFNVDSNATIKDTSATKKATSVSPWSFDLSSESPSITVSTPQVTTNSIDPDVKTQSDSTIPEMSIVAVPIAAVAIVALLRRSEH